MSVWREEPRTTYTPAPDVPGDAQGLVVLGLKVRLCPYPRAMQKSKDVGLQAHATC